MSGVRTIAIGVFLPCALALAACESRPPPTEPQAPVVQATTTTSAGFVVHVLEDRDPQAVVDYWTPERMRSARPVELTAILDLFRVPMRMAGAHESRILRPGEIASHPHTSIGKVFFVLDDFHFVCSASAVTSEGRWGEGSRNLIVTAGHCVNDGFGGFASKFIFVPGYFDGIAPFGRWPAEQLVTTGQWNSGFGFAFARDVAFAQVRAGARRHTGSELHDVVEALGIVFTEPYPEDGIPLGVEPAVGTAYASFGYGVLNWGGEDQVRSRARVSVLDPNFFPSPQGLPSTHTGGASGGPWLYRYATAVDGRDRNFVNSVNSYVYLGVDVIYGPRFDHQIHALWRFAATL